MGSRRREDERERENQLDDPLSNIGASERSELALLLCTKLGCIAVYDNIGK